MGDPAGIGPDISLTAWQSLAGGNGPCFFVIGDQDVFRKRASLLGGGLRVITIGSTAEAANAFADGLPVLPLDIPSRPVETGIPDPRNALSIVTSIERAVSLVFDGEAAGVVTNPIAKSVLMERGFRHAGHTEFLAELAERHGAGTHTPVMLMASPRLKVVPVTVHIPLREVAAALTRDRLIEVATIVDGSLRRDFGIANPRIAVCGLNPHAGENGVLGGEEIEVISPAIEALRGQGLIISGPHSADTLFHEAARETYDAVLAMYHDQGLIPFKTMSFEDGVNVTLGLPFVRTSPDHGTAFSLAGTGRANPASFIEALRVAANIAHNRSRQPPSAHP
jgi:4-hydroxythreonine-4-phosphate dehydrogenase